ncbi:MAG: HipA domain-containing protein [Proteobacteria bacterium]|nr:HipA domain-containing protein [Pseudomonadota bacterium]
MKRCPITYAVLTDNDPKPYSLRGLRLLSPQLKKLLPLPYSVIEQRHEAIARASKISIQGVQLKLSAALNVKKEVFEFVEKGGTYILKPPHDLWEEVPENEDLTMRLAKLVGIEVPLHGMIYNRDGHLTYFIKRFDRMAKNKKVAVEDFSQLSGNERSSKYKSSCEELIKIVEKYCTFPQIENLKLFERLLFSYLVGNEDMHLKNFSLIRRKGIVELSPAYDLLNTTLIFKEIKEEIALPIRSKKNKLEGRDFWGYLGTERFFFSEKILEITEKKFKDVLETWKDWIQISFLSPSQKELYRKILMKRSHILGLIKADLS